jgi:hypothetical protein
MSDATHGAEEIRNDINALSQRYAVVKRDEMLCSGFWYPEFTSNFSFNYVCLAFPSKRRNVAVTINSSSWCVNNHELNNHHHLPPTNFRSDYPTFLYRYVGYDYWHRKELMEQQGRPGVT